MKQSSSLYPNNVFYCWLFLLVWAPLPLASNRPWALSLLVLITALLALVILIWTLVRRLPLLTRLKPYLLPILLLFCIPLWAFLQTIPLPLGWLQQVSPVSANAYAEAGFETGRITLDIARTQLQAAFSLGLWLFFCMGLLLLDTPQRVRSACMLIVYCGVFQALYGSFMTLSGIEYGFFVEKETYRGVATGTFVNRNHLAGYLEMCLAVGIGLLVASLNRVKHLTWRSRLRSLLDSILGAKIRLRVFLALMVVALVLTHSRMGNTAFFVSLMVCGCLWMILQRRLHKGAIILFVSLVLIDTLIVGQWFGFEEVVQRLESSSTESETRDEVVRDTLVMLQDFSITGSGLGSYESAYPPYQQEDVTGFLSIYDHAHNDYLEFAVELGAVGMLPLIALVLLSLGRAFLSIARRRDPLAKGIAFASSMGIIALLIHSTVDFNLQMPANAMLFIVLIMLAWLSSTLKRES